MTGFHQEVHTTKKTRIISFVQEENDSSAQDINWFANRVKDFKLSLNPVSGQKDGTVSSVWLSVFLTTAALFIQCYTKRLAYFLPFLHGLVRYGRSRVKQLCTLGA